MSSRTIRNDRILWQAHTSSAAFFSVGVTLSSQMVRATHATEPAEANDVTLTKKGSIKIKLN